jgi:hypothetical protein
MAAIAAKQIATVPIFEVCFPSGLAHVPAIIDEIERPLLSAKSAGRIVED